MIGLGGIEMPVAEFHGFDHGLANVLVVDEPGPKTELWNFDAIG
jgi:hypothetical protein